MLQFIDDNTALAMVTIVFQYISCCSLSNSESSSVHNIQNFNTSHVVVYRTGNRKEDCGFSFQYISCCSLSCLSTSDRSNCITISIHLMLQFIKSYTFLFLAERIFQYISCCSLSLYMLETAITQDNFNTSHVVVYRIFGTLRRRTRQFQYISCCSLSLIVPLDQFVEIISIHLMLQFILWFIMCLWRKIKISIHLMLQFIEKVPGTRWTVIRFQYISCCSLSVDLAACVWDLVKFQYISCCSLSDKLTS